MACFFALAAPGGVDCAVCSDGYTSELGFVCRKCVGSAGGIVLAAVLTAVLLAAVVAVVSYVMSGESGERRRGLVDRVARYVPLQSFKIVIVAWQILTQVGGRKYHSSAALGSSATRVLV